MDTQVLYMQIYHTLKTEIEAKQYEVDHQLPTELEMTERFQVSRITVKRALDELESQGYIYRKRGSGSYVLNQTPQAGESTLLDRMIAFVLPSDGSTGLSEYIRGAAEILEARGYYMSIHMTNESPAKERDLLETLPRKGIQGIIVYPINARSNMDILHMHYMNKYPILTIDKYYEGLPVASVVSDNQAGGYMAASNLIQLGHRRIAFVSSVSLEAASSVRNRYFGYAQALRDHGLAIDPSLVVLDYIEEWWQTGEQAYYQKLVKGLMDHGATAIQTENDYVAAKILIAAAELEIQVPEQLSVVGFDNNDIAARLDIPLTTVAQQFYEIGRKAGELIVEAVESGRLSDRIEVPVQWMERSSTGRAMALISKNE